MGTAVSKSISDVFAKASGSPSRDEKWYVVTLLWKSSAAAQASRIAKCETT